MAINGQNENFNQFHLCHLNGNSIKRRGRVICVRIYFSKRIIHVVFINLCNKFFRSFPSTNQTNLTFSFFRMFFVQLSWHFWLMIMSSSYLHSIDHSKVFCVRAYYTLSTTQPIEINTSPCLCTFQLLVGFVVLIVFMHQFEATTLCRPIPRHIYKIWNGFNAWLVEVYAKYVTQRA